MADGGEIAAIFRGLANDAAQAGEDIGRSLERFYTDTAERADDSVTAINNAEGANLEAINGIRTRISDGPASNPSGAGPATGSDASRIARMLNGDHAPPAGPALFSRTPAMSNAAILESGAGLPRTAATVEDVARRAGVDLTGTTVRIIEDPEYIRYLDYQDACACAPFEAPGEMHLGPASFADEESLAATLAHEQTHILQYAAGREPNSGDLKTMEAEAYAAEQPALERLRGEHP